MRHTADDAAAPGSDSYAQEMTPPTSAADDGRQLRRDAARNRQLVLDAAAAAFADNGLDVGYDEIARRASVGVGTVYRRFPDRSDLVTAVFESRVDDVAELAVDALGRPDAWSGLQWFLERLMTLQAGDRGLRQVLAGTSVRDERLAYIQGRLVPVVTELLDRAKAAGAVRPDIEPTDIAALTAILSAMSTPSQPELWRRYLALFLTALPPSQTGSRPLPLTAPTDDELHGLHVALDDVATRHSRGGSR